MIKHHCTPTVKTVFCIICESVSITYAVPRLAEVCFERGKTVKKCCSIQTQKNLAFWTPKDVLYLGQQSLFPVKKCNQSPFGKINDHWSPAQATRAANRCFSLVGVSSKIVITHFLRPGLHLCPISTKPKDSWWYLLCFVLFSKARWCGWCLLIAAFLLCAPYF